MASRSRAAQEKLVELESASAPFDDQLVEAAKFIGVDLLEISGHKDGNYAGGNNTKLAASHGREEWLLRWLLKKLQAPKDEIPRKTPASWHLFCYLIQVIPLPNSARMLNERKFMTILRQVLEETQKAASDITTGGSKVKNTSQGGSVLEEQTARTSKKRQRSGELVAKTNQSRIQELKDLLASIFTAMNCMTRSKKSLSEIHDGGRGTTISTEYLKSVVRTTAEHSAKILGLWLSLSHTMLEQQENLDNSVLQCWLSPFIEVWESHTVGNEDMMEFSLHCSQAVLSLLRSVGKQILPVTKCKWTTELEQLVVRQIIIPARAAKLDQVESDLLRTLTRVSVLQDAANAQVLFDIAIRSIVPQGSRRRRAEDVSWLGAVFTTLKEAMPAQRSEQNSTAICGMLRSAIDHKVDLDLEILRSVTSEYALPEGHVNWELLAIIIELDGNVFLISNNDQDLLKDLLKRITSSSIGPAWPNISDKVVSDVVVPLMNEFFRARDLSGFIRHWYNELVEFERLRKDDGLILMALFSAWEHDALQVELSKLLEASLTVQQIIQILDWLELRVNDNPDAVCVLLDAIAGSITGEEVVDAVGIRLCRIMHDNGMSDKLHSRYKWRFWRILSRTLQWVTAAGVEEIAELWHELPHPLHSQPVRISNGSGLLEIHEGNSERLETLELLRFGCASWSAARKGTRMEMVARPAMVGFLQLLVCDIKSFLQDLARDQYLGDERCGSSQNTLYRGTGWMVWSFTRCVLLEYPQVLELGPTLPDGIFGAILENIFWIVSSTIQCTDSQITSRWLQINGDAFSSVWLSAMRSDNIQNNSEVIGQIVDVMLRCETHLDNPLVKSRAWNEFGIQSLLMLPLEIFSKKDRERVMTQWQPNIMNAGSDDTEELLPIPISLYPAVLSLKTKIMHRPISYEGMKFQDLVDLAKTLASSKIPNQAVNLALFKEFAKLTLSHTVANLDQPRNRAYTLEALSYVQKKTTSKSAKMEKWNSGIVTLLEAVLVVLGTKSMSLNDLDIISSAELSTVTTSFSDSLLLQLRDTLLHSKKSTKPSKLKCNGEKASLSIICILDALAAIDVDGSKVAELADDAKSFIVSQDKTGLDVGERLNTFIATKTLPSNWKALDTHIEGDISTAYGRQSIMDMAQALVVGKDQQEKLDLVEDLFGDNLVGLTKLENLLASRHIIMTCEDTRKSADEEIVENQAFDLSTAYSVLCNNLWKTAGLRQFCLISEILEMMLRTKGRVISQWNIDSTLGMITIMCSRSGPNLRSNRSGTIYLHLCRLMQAILTSHRLKLDGHFHLVIQTMQSLLRCLFTPLPHSATNIANIFPPPPWLSSPSHQLGATHAAAYSRLLSLICDPSVSSVTRSGHSNLTSARDKAKRMAGQHMQFVLTTYIKLQLEMKMLPIVREKMVPGLYAMFDTTTPEMRRMISDSLDSSGRAVYGTLFRDYQRFGKWKGS